MPIRRAGQPTRRHGRGVGQALVPQSAGLLACRRAPTIDRVMNPVEFLLAILPSTFRLADDIVKGLASMAMLPRLHAPAGAAARAHGGVAHEADNGEAMLRSSGA